MFKEDVKEAIESSCSASYGSEPRLGRPEKRRRPETVRTIVLMVVRELPGDLSVAELVDHLEDITFDDTTS